MRWICAAWCVLVFAALLWAETAADALFAEAIAAAKAGRLDAAATTFEKGRSAYPADARFPIELAGIAYRQKRLSEAKRWLRRGLKLAPNDAYANDFLGTLYQLDGNLPATLKYWNRIGAPYVSRVVFRPSGGMDPAFRSRLFVFSGGQVLTLGRLEMTQSNLLRTNILAAMRIDLLSQVDKQYQAIVDMQPKAIPLRGWLGRLLPVARDLPYQGVDLDWYDIGGRGANFTSLWRWDPDKRRVDLEWTAPVHGNPRNEYRVWVDGRDERWDLRDSYAGGPDRLAVRSVSAGVDYVTALTGKLQWTVGGTVGRHLFGTEKPDSSALFNNAWTATLDDRFDYQLWSVPEHRVSTRTWGLFNVGRTFGGGDASRLIVTRGGVSGEWFPQAKGDTYRLTTQMQAGRIVGNVPIDELFQLGMERDTERDLWLRGIRSAADGRKGTGLLGREYTISQTTFERQVFHLPFVTINVGPFFDAGWVADSDPMLLNRGAVFDAGLQASMRTIGGVGLTVVYGRDLQSGRGAFYTATSR